MNLKENLSPDKEPKQKAPEQSAKPAEAGERIFISYKRGVQPDDTLASQLGETFRHQYAVFFDRLIPVVMSGNPACFQKSTGVIFLLSCCPKSRP